MPLKRLLGEQGLHASDSAEEQSVRVLLSPGPEPSEQALLQRGQAPTPHKVHSAWGSDAGFGFGPSHTKVYVLSSSEQRRPTLSTSQ